MAVRVREGMRRKSVQENIRDAVWFLNRELSPLLRNAVDVLNGKQDMAGGATYERPASPVIGERWFDTTLGYPVWWNGTLWVPAYTAPTPHPPERGMLYGTTSAGVICTTWQPSNTTTVLHPLSTEFSMPANNQLQHDDDAEEVYLVELHCVIGSTSVNQNVYVGIGKNGNDPTIDAQTYYRRIGTGTDTGAVSMATLMSLGPLDYIQGMCLNVTSANQVSFHSMQLIATKSV